MKGNTMGLYAALAMADTAAKAKPTSMAA